MCVRRKQQEGRTRDPHATRRAPTRYQICQHLDLGLCSTGRKKCLLRTRKSPCSLVTVAPTGRLWELPIQVPYETLVCKYFILVSGSVVFKNLYFFGLQTFKKLQEKYSSLLPHHPDFPIGGILENRHVSELGNRHFHSVSGDSRLNSAFNRVRVFLICGT